MQIIFRDSPDFELALKPLQHRHAFSRDVDEAVKVILQDVRERGDAALVDYARKFDKAELTPDKFRVTEQEIAEAAGLVDAKTRLAIETAAAHLRAFAERQRPQDWEFSPRNGVVLGEQFSPIARVGCYIPGGTAPLISTVLHTVTLASTAGVPEIVVITPPGPGGKINPALLFACQTAGATEIYRLGGVYGVAALAYGTATVPKVEKIVGPGNAYVTAAKRQVYGEVSLDQVAGPSEILIIADGQANPAFLAADLLSQAEHGSGREQAVLLCTDRQVILQTSQELARQAALLHRADCIQKVLDNGVFLVEVKDMAEAVALCNSYAPEHLEIQAENARDIAKGITAAGAIFLGSWTPEPVGDFVAGPSHVLPTGGSARFFSGLTISQFYRRSSLAQYSREALQEDLPHILCFASKEGLDGHGHSASIRFE